MRVPQPEGTRGSLKWIQRLADQVPSLLDEPLRRAGCLERARRLEWLSPLRDDAWAEYRDAGFLERIGHVGLTANLKAFWPSGGPQWDGLATDGHGRVFLLEAKAHAPEMRSMCKARKTSLDLIRRSLQETKRELGASPESDWLTGYYQYANRLAHLVFLTRNAIDARLVFLYFVGDEDLGGPSSIAQWEPHLSAAHVHLGLRERVDRVVSLFADVKDLHQHGAVEP